MLKADKRINFGKVRLVMKAANDAQFTTVGIMTQNQQAGEQIVKGKT
jgi:biopolymer transport protein ExbD